MYTLAQPVSPILAVTDPCRELYISDGFPCLGRFLGWKHPSHQPWNRAARGLQIWDYGV